jgi:peptidylprolyl isomerase
VPTDKRQRQKEGQRARREAARAELQKQQRRRRFRSFAILAVLVVGAMVLVSVLGGDDDDDSETASSTDSTTSTTEAVTTPTSAKPELPEPGGDAPVTELKIEDIEVGDGKVIEKGDTIVAHYLGATYKDGKEFQASWDSGQTFETVIGEGNVIKGWDEGIPGMKVGGRRKLIIPAADAYGAEDTGDGRPHGDLVFIIDVYAVK